MLEIVLKQQVLEALAMIASGEHWVLATKLCYLI